MMTTSKNITKSGRAFRNLLPVLLAALVLTACKKDSSTQTGLPHEDSHNIKYVLNDNFTFSIACFALQYSGTMDTLAKPGPYTMITPNDAAYSQIGLNVAAPGTFSFFTGQELTAVMKYHMIKGDIAFKKLEIKDNQPFATVQGGNVYVSKYLNGKDTIVTVNGATLIDQDEPASNGLVQVSSQVLRNPEVYPNLVDYARNNLELTLFVVALQRSGLDKSMFAGRDVYTVMAPSNMAFQNTAKLGLNLGLSTVDSILNTDPVKLAGILKYHMLSGRYFENDLFRAASADPANGMNIKMLNGKTLTVGGNATGFNQVTFLGNRNPTAANIAQSVVQYNPSVNYANIPCGNGIIHIIDRVLVPNN